MSLPRLLRGVCLFSFAALVASCNHDIVAPRPPVEGEVPRGDYHLLIERYTRAGERSFVTMGADGSFVAPFAGVPTDARELIPSPDGRTIAYLHNADDLVDLWVMNRDGSNRHPIVTGEIVIGHAAWSANGKRLAFERSSMEQTSDIWTVNADGSEARNLTPDPSPAVLYDQSPEWSPDGTRIAFASTRSGPTRLWTMNADGSNIVQVIPQSVPEAERTPVWSPDGQLIAFAATRPSDAGVGVVRPDGGGYRFYPLAGDAGRPMWLPDGRLLYTTNITGDYEVYALDLASGISTNLTRHRDHDYRVMLLRYVAPAAWLGFGSPAVYAAAHSEPRDIVAGDIDGDGMTDLAVLAPADAELRILRGRPGGVFERLGSLQGDASHKSLYAGNVTVGAIADLVALGESSFSIWRGGPAGPGVADVHELPGPTRGITIGDFDGNGLPDIATIVERPGAGFHLLIHAWRAPDDIIPVVDAATEISGAGRACSGDVTGEGARDIVILTSSASRPVVLLAGRGDISFEGPLTAATGFANDAETIPLCVDLNGDGRADLVTLEPNGMADIALTLSNGSSFGTPRSVGMRGTSVAAADVDRDGDVDLLVVNRTTPAVQLLRNLGDGHFAAPVSIALGREPVRVLAADLNGDAWPDVAIAHGDGSVSVLLNRGT